MFSGDPANDVALVGHPVVEDKVRAPIHKHVHAQVDRSGVRGDEPVRLDVGGEDGGGASQLVHAET